MFSVKACERWQAAFVEDFLMISTLRNNAVQNSEKHLAVTVFPCTERSVLEISTQKQSVETPKGRRKLHQTHLLVYVYTLQPGVLFERVFSLHV